jgi:DNA-binding NarL/FixJ family response regulator
MDKAIRIIIADDHAMFRQGLKVLLSGQSGFEVIGEAGDGDEAFRLVGKHKPDILLLNVDLPKVCGLEVLRLLAEAKSTVRTILLNGTAEDGQVTRAFELGARGVASKYSTLDTLIKCVRGVMHGYYWIGNEGVVSLAETLKHHRAAEKKVPPKNFGLTPRELQILGAAVSGHSNKAIAATYAISEQTVKHHITSIFDKLGVYNRLELTLFAFHHGLAEK